MDVLNGVIDILTGLLLRAGYCDFTNDGSFDPLTEAQHANVPQPYYVLNNPDDPTSEYITHWNGSDWDLVPRV